MRIGDIHTEKIKITTEKIQQFGTFSEDFNPIHFDDSAAQAHGFPRRIAHGMASAAFFSKIIAQSFPGPGSVYLGQTLKFSAPVFIDETLTFKLEVVAQKDGKPIFTLKTEAYGEDQTLKISGEAVIKNASH